MHEFNLIHQYFTWDNSPSDVSISVGDDAAVIDIPADKQLVTSIDTLISGVHFPQETSPDAIGHKALAVNISDLAAMGATPKWFTLALTLPEVDETWLREFSSGLKRIAQCYGCFLVGGDTTRGPLSISIQVMGLVDKGKALLRSGAVVGDKIYVTGTLGDAKAGLNSLLHTVKELDNDHRQYCEKRLNYPTPRLNEGITMRNLVTSCIDLSDGLLQDLMHVLKASHVGAQIDLDELPLSPALQSIDVHKAQSYALSGGDDYELLFTVSKENESTLCDQTKNNIRCIGTITDKAQTIVDIAGRSLQSTGYNHFHD